MQDVSSMFEDKTMERDPREVGLKLEDSTPQRFSIEGSLER